MHVQAFSCTFVDETRSAYYAETDRQQRANNRICLIFSIYHISFTFEFQLNHMLYGDHTWDAQLRQRIIAQVQVCNALIDILWDVVKSYSCTHGLREKINKTLYKNTSIFC